MALQIREVWVTSTDFSSPVKSQFKDVSLHLEHYISFSIRLNLTTATRWATEMPTQNVSVLQVQSPHTVVGVKHLVVLVPQFPM